MKEYKYIYYTKKLYNKNNSLPSKNVMGFSGPSVQSWSWRGQAVWNDI